MKLFDCTEQKSYQKNRESFGVRVALGHQAIGGHPSSPPLDPSTSRPLTGPAPGYATRPSTAQLAPGPWPLVSGTWNDDLGHPAADWPDTFLAKGWGRRHWALNNRISDIWYNELAAQCRVELSADAEPDPDTGDSEPTFE